MGYYDILCVAPKPTTIKLIEPELQNVLHRFFPNYQRMSDKLNIRQHTEWFEKIISHLEHRICSPVYIIITFFFAFSIT